ncbi:1-acylglycerol-3-phosphate O-acyltransferase [Thoreauomyces humboldtii]|nr:1-acylglycerol-3-phosphate O-acyltransferase [Thoreauomyces humboldtii]
MLSVVFIVAALFVPVLLLLQRVPGPVSYYTRLLGFACAIWISCLVGLAVGPLNWVLGDRGATNRAVSRTMHRVGPFLTGVSVKVVGGDILATTNVPAVFVANHQSSLDILCLGAVFPRRVAVMAKKSLRYVPLLGWFMTLANNVFIDRGNAKSARDTMGLVAQVLSAQQRGLWLFPEGTRSHQINDTLLPFKKGAFHLAVQGGFPIVPIVFSTYAPCYEPAARRFIPGVITVKVLEPIETRGKTAADVDALLELTRSRMQAALVTIKTIPASPVATKAKKLA